MTGEPAAGPVLPVPSWLRDEPTRLLEFARASAHPVGGFAWLDDAGHPLLRRPVETWISCRMTHVFALATLAGRPDLRPLVDHGVAGLRGGLRDAAYGGWFTAISESGPVADDKRAYEHAFVVLAAASATAAGATGAAGLLGEALDTVDRRFWDDDEGLVADVWDRAWTSLEDYRGVNANMHMVEAFLAAADVTGEPLWSSRAARVLERVVHRFARGNDWRLPEHFDSRWQVQLEYNRDDPAHPFRPYGVTVGHLLECARLATHLRHALGTDAPDWLLEDARSLFRTAVRDGWSVDGAEGFVYTIDFDGRPVVRDRMHWVVAEAIAAASALHAATRDDEYATWFRRWCDHARTRFVDYAAGSWHHQLDPHNRPASTVWTGKPDIYHAYQAATLPLLGDVSSFAGAGARR